ncbi:hypothetical protein [Streptomyces brevispora]|uniref:MFS transporter n=1 Tax=Streptomyces brevispora TaxID=887462 RepID=A0ABZ1FYY7_9ACTN|nr:hypothetical protein [Streptomyces brevispora]WSC12814.1 hypothetical protein OIE64_08175 [Streptomyces brevispora]
MTDLTTCADGAATGTGNRSRPRVALPPLCLTQIADWGSSTTPSPALLARITVDTGWSSGATTGAFSLTLLVSTAADVPISRILDRRGPHLVRAGGSALAVVGMVTVAFAPNPLLFYAAWAVRQAKGAAR